jgi:cGMP-dependent protein kinase
LFSGFINISGDDKERDVGTLSHGKYFGELALLKEDTRQATVTAMPPGAECLVLDRGYVTYSMT